MSLMFSPALHLLLLGAGASGAGLPAAPALSDALKSPARCSKQSNPLADNGFRHFVASALSGAMGVTALAPVEVVRLSLMINPEQGFMQAVKSVNARGGWFQGNTADTLAAAIKVGVTMPAFAFFKTRLTSAAIRWGGLPEDAPAPRWIMFAAGALAGTTATCVAFPLDVVRTRMAMECPLDMNVATCMIGIGGAEGIGALYRGLSTTVAGVLPFSSVKLASYDLLRRRASQGVDDASYSLPVRQSASFGALAGIVAATSCFPLEVVRRRQMMGEFATLSVYRATMQIFRSEGLQALYKGVRLNCVKVGMANSLGFAFYEFAKDSLAVDGRTPPWRKLQLSPKPVPAFAPPPRLTSRRSAVAPPGRRVGRPQPSA